jgi:hypothetical protein
LTATAMMTPKLAKLEGKTTRAQPVWRCQYCAQGHHGSCPGATRQRLPDGKERMWLCKCEAPGHPGLHCLECKNEFAPDVNPETWRCYDEHVCAGILQKRREHSELWQMIQAAKSRSALRRRAGRTSVESLLGGVDTDVDAKIESLHQQLDAILDAKKAKRPKKRSMPRVRTGVCECCGEATRGGRFLPGHDARHASVLRARVVSGDGDAYEEMKTRGWLKKLPAKYVRPGDLVAQGGKRAR